jgi:chorismate mutase
MMRCRGIKGATTSPDNSEEAILAATRELLKAMISMNGVQTEEIAAVFFTSTVDLNSVFPARAARELGLDGIPLLCAQEIEVARSLPRCLRVLLLVNTEKGQSQLRHLYLREARELRPEFAWKPTEAL